MITEDKRWKCNDPVREIAGTDVRYAVFGSELPSNLAVALCSGRVLCPTALPEWGYVQKRSASLPLFALSNHLD